MTKIRLYSLLLLGVVMISPAYGINYPTEGEAYIACVAYAATFLDNQTGEPYGQCVLHPQGGSYRACNINNIQPDGSCTLAGTTLFTWDTSCLDKPDGNNMFDVLEPGIQCLDGCEYEPTTGTCDEFNICLIKMETTGEVCEINSGAPPIDDPGLPPNCARNEETGAVACDCSVDPTQAFCINPPPPNVPSDCSLVDNSWSCVSSDPPSDPDLPPGVNCTYDAAGVFICSDNPNPPGGGDDPTNPPGGQNPPDDSPDPDDGTPGTPDVSTGCDTPPCEADDNQDNSSDTGGSGSGSDVEDAINRNCNPESNSKCAHTGSATTSGSCETPPTCEGEPIRCAILHQQWQVMCYPYKDTGTQLEPWAPIDRAAEGLDQLEDEIDLSTETLDQTSFLVASCPNNEFVGTAAGIFELDYGPFCQAAGFMSYLVLAMAGIIGARIIGGGI